MRWGSRWRVVYSLWSCGGTSALVTGRVFHDILMFLYFLSGVGGQIDFLRGAALGHDGLGKPILALNSVTKRGGSKIVPFLKEGT